MVLEKWFYKLGFFFLVNRTRKKVVYGINSPCFLVNHFSWTTFLEPDFSNQISTNCKNRGRRIKGPMGFSAWLLCYLTTFFRIERKRKWWGWKTLCRSRCDLMRFSNHKYFSYSARPSVFIRLFLPIFLIVSTTSVLLL